MAQKKKSDGEVTVACQEAQVAYRKAMRLSFVWNLIHVGFGLALVAGVLMLLVIGLTRAADAKAYVPLLVAAVTGGAHNWLKRQRLEADSKARAALTSIGQYCGDLRQPSVQQAARLRRGAVVAGLVISALCAFLLWTRFQDPAGAILRSLAQSERFVPVVQLGPTSSCKQFFIMGEGRENRCEENGRNLLAEFEGHPNWRSRIEPTLLAQEASGDVTLLYDVTMGSVNGDNCRYSSKHATLLIQLLDSAGHEVQGKAPWTVDTTWLVSDHESLRVKLGAPEGLDLSKASSFKLSIAGAAPEPEGCTP